MRINKHSVLAIEQLERVSGGTCFPAGTPDQQRVWMCPAHCKNKYRTGKEIEEPLLHFWSRHKKEYYCPDCNTYWWVHED